MFANDYAKLYCIKYNTVKVITEGGGGFNMAKIEYVICEGSVTAIA